MQRSEILRTLQSLAPHDHAVLFYSDIGTKRELVFPYLFGALENQGIALYLTGHEPLDEVRDAIRLRGVNVDRRQSDGSLTITDYHTMMTANGQLDSGKIDRWLRDLAKRGKPVRIVADQTSLVKRGLIDDVVRSERALTRRLEVPLTVVCSFEDETAEAREGEFLVEMLRTHSHAIFPGIALLLT